MPLVEPLARFARPSATVSIAPKRTRAKGLSAARVGLILLDSSLKPVYCNSETLSIVAYPKQPPKALNAAFSQLIRSMIGKRSGARDFPATTQFVSGRRRYLCRTFALEPESHGGSRPEFAITVERDSMVPELAARFQLTDREAEAVRCLADGLTSKEIAQRMNISPNTVKTFFRLVMIKMHVTTRAGVVGRLVNGAAR